MTILRQLRQQGRFKLFGSKKNGSSFLQRHVPILIFAVAVILTFVVIALSLNTYIIVDCGEVFMHYSFSSNIEKVLSSSNRSIGEEDKISYWTDLDGRESIIVIHRAKNTVVIDGDIVYEDVCTGETVAQILEELGIALEPYDTTIPELRSRDVEKITISRAYTEIIEVTETIPYETLYYIHNNLGHVTTLVDRQGYNGERKDYYLVKYTGDGEEVNRALICSEVTAEAVNALLRSDDYDLNALGGNDSWGSKFLVEYNESGGVITTIAGEVYSFSSKDTFQCTAYSNEGRTWNITYSGTVVGVGVVAVDPKVIPLGTKLFIASDDGDYVYGYCVAEDTGEVVEGKIIDLYFDTEAECWQFGRRDCTVYFLS